MVGLAEWYQFVRVRLPLRNTLHGTEREAATGRGVLVLLPLASGQDHQALYWQTHRSLYRPPGRGGNSFDERESALVFSASASCSDEEQHGRDQGAGGQTHSDALVMGKRQHNLATHDADDAAPDIKASSAPSSIGPC